jgi:alanine-alpha-ketoisovalerate/valine-pyruvate aminotransferase
MSNEKRAGLETAYKKRIARFARHTQEQIEAEKDSVYMPLTPECIGNKNILQDNQMFSTSACDVEMEIAQALINLSEFSDAQTVNTNVNMLIKDKVVEEPHSTTTSDTSQTDDIASMFRSYLVDIILDDPLH